MRYAPTAERISRRASQRHEMYSSDLPFEAGREPPLGAHVVTPRRGYTHHGIYVGRGCVVQYAGLSRGFRSGPVEEVPLSRFSRGRPIWIRLADLEWKDRPEVVERARERLGEARYHPLTNNCEHFTEWCLRGEHRSHQVDNLLDRCSRMWRRIVGPVAIIKCATVLTHFSRNGAHVLPPTSCSDLGRRVHP